VAYWRDGCGIQRHTREAAAEYSDILERQLLNTGTLKIDSCGIQGHTRDTAAEYIDIHEKKLRITTTYKKNSCSIHRQKRQRQTREGGIPNK
jgi:hypothetical protein